MLRRTEPAKQVTRAFSLDWEDGRIAKQEQAIRRWIAEVGHAQVVADCGKNSPLGWTGLSGAYETEWPECEFGASVVLFRTICSVP